MEYGKRSVNSEISYFADSDVSFAIYVFVAIIVGTRLEGTPPLATQSRQNIGSVSVKVAIEER